jgi:glutaminyl-peptide cyclotransferase
MSPAAERPHDCSDEVAMPRSLRRCTLFALLLALLAAGPAWPARAQEELPIYSYTVVASYPHDPGAFTQGLVYLDGLLYEGTGGDKNYAYGPSSLRRVTLETGEVQQPMVTLDGEYFGEGIAVVGERIFQLTWKNQRGFIYDRASFAKQGEFSYPTEGWGLTYDGSRLIMSDGSDTIYFADPEETVRSGALAVTGQIAVRAEGQPVTRINELEYIDGKIYANIWQTDLIAIIDPANGQVTGWVDLAGLLTEEERAGADVLNGIAYDAANDRLLVTGKLWPRLFEVDLVAPPQELPAQSALPIIVSQHTPR